MDTGFPATPRHAQLNPHIRWRHKPCGLFRPLHQAQGGGIAVIAKACVKPLPWIDHTIQIKVLQGECRKNIRFDQGVCGAFDTPRIAQGAHDAAHERGLARAQVALQIHHHARPQSHSQPGSQRQHGRFVGQRQRLVRRIIVAMHAVSSPTRYAELARQIKAWGQELGFAQIGIADTDLSAAELHLHDWLANEFHGEMDYMAAHGTKRSRPRELVPGTVRVITARLTYWPDAADAVANLAKPKLAYVSRYAVGRNYHKVLRKRLQQLAEKIESEIGPFGYRVFTDSAPVMEVELATKSGLGWRGKHTLLINRDEGSYFFLGEIYTGLPLPVDAGLGDHCGSCFACAAACPTGAIVAPYQVDARRCISYLTIELKGSIPVELRPLMGNRIYGCDDCQLACPWNRFARTTDLPDFQPRHELDSATLAEVFAWSEEEFHKRTEGSAIRRIGHERWLRNIAVALGNAPASNQSITALKARLAHPSALVREHVEWALSRLLL